VEIKQIESFVRVAELGSFTKAAIAMGLAQPLLSRHVRQLEVELHQNLLIRNGRGVSPTASGLLMLEHARNILHQVALAKEELSGAVGTLSGPISIGLPPSLSKLITVPLTLAFQKALPQAKLTLTEGFSAPMYESLRTGSIDIALLYNPAPTPELEQLLLHEDALILIASKQPLKQLNHLKPHKETLSLKELCELPLIVPSRPNAFRLLIETEMHKIGKKPNVVLEIDGINAIIELVKEGLGFAVLPTYTLSQFPDTRAFTTHAIKSPQLLSQLKLVWSAKRPVTRTHQWSLELTQQIIRTALG
jgi:LysR family transcriptional regulator, nitrogen assimilation regulatory protein